MAAEILLHPSVISAARGLFRNWGALSETTQLILCTLIQVRLLARSDLPLPESLAGTMRVLGSLSQAAPRQELDTAYSEIYATLEAIAARERGEASREWAAGEVWFRETS